MHTKTAQNHLAMKIEENRQSFRGGTMILRTFLFNFDTNGQSTCHIDLYYRKKRKIHLQVCIADIMHTHEYAIS